MSELLRLFEVLFIIDDFIANESLDKNRQPLLELFISARDQGHYLSLLAQSYTTIPENLRRQAKAIFVWYSKVRGDLKMIHDENDMITDHELLVARGLYISNKFPCGFKLLNHV